MAATVKIREWHGPTGTPVKTDKTSGTIRFKNADDAGVNLNNPMVVPGSGSDWSYEKWLRAAITAGSFTQVSNLRAYSDGANGLGTGVSLYYRTVGTYAPPAEETGATGLTDFFSATSGSPVDMDATNTGPFTATGDIGDFIVMALAVGSTASQGVTSSEGLTLAYDEI